MVEDFQTCLSVVCLLLKQRKLCLDETFKAINLLVEEFFELTTTGKETKTTTKKENKERKKTGKEKKCLHFMYTYTL